MPTRVTFAGVTEITGARMTRSRGARPSVGTFTMIPQEDMEFGAGSFSWLSDMGNVVLRNCVADVAHLRPRQVDGAWRWDVTVFDRRIHWQRYGVDGEYNRRHKDGTIDETTRKTAAEIAEVLLDGFEEEDYDTSGMPEVYPHCNWRGARAAAAFQWLCEYCSVAIGFDTDDNVKLTAYGEGDDLPSESRINQEYRFRRPRPGKIEAVSGPTVYQSLLNLAARMVDDDKTLKFPDNVNAGSKPPDGWTYAPWTAFNLGISPDWHAYQEFARWWLVMGQKDRTLTVPGSSTEITSVSQILPLHQWLVSDLELDGTDPARKIARPPYLRGNFWPQVDLPITVEDQRWAGEFRIHYDDGLVVTEYPVFILPEFTSLEADFNLAAAYNVRNAETSELDRERRTTELGGAFGTAIIVRPDVFGTYDNIGDTDTREQAGEELQAYLDQFAKRYSDDGLTCDVAHLRGGFVPCPLDGRIEQIVLDWGYGQVPGMTISTGYEHDIYNQSFDQSLRTFEKISPITEAVA